MTDTTSPPNRPAPAPHTCVFTVEVLFAGKRKYYCRICGKAW